jgi:hypothetical protein
LCRGPEIKASITLSYHEVRINEKSAAAILMKEWELDVGFFGQLREGKFDTEASDRLIQILESIEISQENEIDRTFVRFVWFMPIFLEWQLQGHKEDEVMYGMIDKSLNKILTELYRLLGIP